MQARRYQTFRYKDSNLRIASDRFAAVCEEVRAQRSLLEGYILRQPDFLRSFVPLAVLPDAPGIARRMAEAARLTGVGPMAAVAGALAQCGVEAALRRGAREAIVENGGDIFLSSPLPVNISIYAGPGSPFNCLAFTIAPRDMPLAVCSSSSRMGHSASLGRCQLATVFARDGALADAAATQACDLIRSAGDLEPALDRLRDVAGIQGLFAICEGRIGIGGRVPPFVRQRDPQSLNKITRDRNACFPGEERDP